MEITAITNEQLAKALTGKFQHQLVNVRIKGVQVEDMRPIGSVQWFEYHCNESHDSSDAQAWYRSHQQVTVLDVVGDTVAFTTFLERGEQGHQIIYHVRFQDGLEWDVFEDELLDSPDHFTRPNPPLPATVV